MDQIISLLPVLQTGAVNRSRRSRRCGCAMKAARVTKVLVTLALFPASLLLCTFDCKAALFECALVQLNRSSTIENALWGGISARFRPRSDLSTLNLAISNATAILQLTPDTSSASVSEVRHRLDQLDRQANWMAQGSGVEAPLAYVRLPYRLPTSASSTLIAMRDFPQKEERTMIATHLVTSRTETQWHGKILYATSLIVVALLVRLVIRLRSRINALQRSATLAHVIAGISLRFINAQLQNIDKEIDRAVTDLAACIGSDRAYFVMSGPAPRLHLWHKSSLPPPRGWPVAAVALAAQLKTFFDGVIHIPRVSRMPVGEKRNRCLELGLGGWACATISGKDGARLVLGFDAVGSTSLVRTHEELALLQTALDSIVKVVERHETETERARLENCLQRARRMEKIGIFTNGVAHSFNNVLGGILGHSEMIEERAELDSRSARNLAAIRCGAERARDLVDQMLTFAPGRDVHRQPLRVSALISETASLLGVSLPEKIELVVRQPTVAAIVSGEHALLQQIMLDLCDCAARAMHDGGRIEIATELHYVADTLALSHDELSSGQYVCITVTDTGNGMDETTRERIFEPFFTTGSSANCLGLATVREIIHDHGGAVHVQSESNKGSRFEIWLPKALSISDSHTSAFPNGRDKTVLLVAPDRERVRRDEEVLATLGYEPIGFTNPDAALAACRADSSRFDMAVVGHFESTARSLEFAAALHASVPRLPIVLASLAVIRLSADTLMAAGVSDVVGWPIIAKEIATALVQSSLQTPSEDRLRRRAKAGVPSR
ncbi:ATP-binding protein [Bradyrhizobium elkanii]|uniref:ATP-binding protein n=1 Tax=Bradyrhizobium elkanii TaxID=29448 RepID=UPI00159F017A|nr:ATP-binding protein [Bradyrhizobium elkanii]